MSDHYEVVGPSLPTEQPSTELPSGQPAAISSSIAPESSLLSDPPPSQELCLTKIPVAPAPPTKVHIQEVTKARKKRKKKRTKKKKRPQSSGSDPSVFTEQKDDSKKVLSTSDQGKGLNPQEQKTRRQELICGCKKTIFIVLASICSGLFVLVVAVIIFCLVEAYTADGIWPNLGAALRLIFKNTTNT